MYIPKWLLVFLSLELLSFYTAGGEFFTTLYVIYRFVNQ